MMSKEEREERGSRRSFEEFIEIYKQLSPWDQFRIRLRMYWYVAIQKITEFPARWFKFQMDLEEDMKDSGMPRQLRWYLTKWFNYRPYSDITTYFLWKRKRIWYHSFLEEDNYELHLRYKNHIAGMVLLQPEKDGTATIISIHVGESFRNFGLGTTMFQEAISQVKDKVTCIKGVLEKEYHPDPEPSLRWLHRQGFQTTLKENGDYELELWLK